MHSFSFDPEKVIQELGKEKLLQVLEKMLLIRNFEIRAEAAYQQGKVGGFFHSYIGQEAIQTAVIEACGKEHWFSTTYRCHALALLLGCTPEEIMAELYGKKTGNTQGRGGSMHLYTDRMLGGFGIVGGHVPIATGAGFALKYQEQKEQISWCFLGEGAVAQGAVYESLNLASLWSLPVIYVVENNLWGMGTGVSRAISLNPIGEKLAAPFGLKGYTIDGMNFLACFAFFQEALEEVLKTSRPIVVEAVTQRFKGHSVSDPALYRSKEALQEAMQKDPILFLQKEMEKRNFLSEEQMKEIEKKQREKAISAMEFAEKSPFPDPTCLEEGVFSP